MAEAWLRGPIEGIPPLLMPAAHALVQAREDLHAAVASVPDAALWERPGGAASIGFHLRHIAGSLDRLLAYALARPLDERQRTVLAREGQAGDPPAGAPELLAGVDAAIDHALHVLRTTAEADLLAYRSVGRAELPSNVIGLLFHAAEHTQRHTGQVIATAKALSAATERS